MHAHRQWLHNTLHTSLDEVPANKNKIHKPYSDETVRAVSRDKTRLLRLRLALSKEARKIDQRILLRLWKEVALFYYPDAKLARLYPFRKIPTPVPFKPTCLASCSWLFATRHKLSLQIAQLEVTLLGALLLQKWSLWESKNAYVQRSLEDVSQAKVNLWDTMKVFRIGTDGRKVPQYMQILPQFTDTQGEPYATSH